ncbi:unnamed protein product [Prorocentrum cordatum]|uniref:Uncharacterized protein n=1 Tax=Prorocentrum cordatum TaxID=2364126 RepID=A0ABN9X1W2_9DINO|nr:unnamed protein product [Polarella glacialis]
MAPCTPAVTAKVLRYIYCGAIYFHQGFRAGFAQFLSVVDFLGVEDMAERQGPAAGGLFAEPGLVQWLQDLQTEDILAFLRDESIAGMLEHGNGAVGFRILCSFLAKLIELRPRDLTVGVLGEDLYERLADFGAPRPRRPRAGPHGSQASAHHLREQLAGDEEEGDGQACLAEPPCPKPDGPLQRLLHLPGPVVYVVLGTGAIRCVNVGGLEPLRNLARDAPSEPSGDAMGDGHDGADPASGSAGARSQTSLLWHEGSVLPPHATRESLLSDDEPLHREVVVFQDSADGQQIFRHTLRRAEARRPEEAELLALALDALVAEAEERTPEGAAPDEVQLVYDSIHDMVNDLLLNRDFNHQGPCLMVAGTRPGGAAALAGLQFGSTLVQQTGPQATEEPSDVLGNGMAKLVVGLEHGTRRLALAGAAAQAGRVVRRGAGLGDAEDDNSIDRRGTVVKVALAKARTDPLAGVNDPAGGGNGGRKRRTGSRSSGRSRSRSTGNSGSRSGSRSRSRSSRGAPRSQRSASPQRSASRPRADKAGAGGAIVAVREEQRGSGGRSTKVIRLRIERLPTDFTEDELADLGASFGDVVHVRMWRYKEET